MEAKGREQVKIACRLQSKQNNERNAVAPVANLVCPSVQ